MLNRSKRRQKKKREKTEQRNMRQGETTKENGEVKPKYI